MDWTQYMSGLFALGGTVVGGMITYAIQARAQRNDNFRHRQKLAYEIAFKTWEIWANRRFTESDRSGVNLKTPSLVHFLTSHIRLAGVLNKTDFSKMSDTEIFSALESMDARDEALLAFLKDEFTGRTKKPDK